MSTFSLSLPLRLLPWREEVSPRAKRWMAVLDAAMCTDHYRAVHSRLEWARHVARYRVHVECAAPVTAAAFFARPAAFRNPYAPDPAPAPIGEPWPGARGSARVVALKPWFRMESRAEALHTVSWRAVSALSPEVLAGTVESLCALAGEMLREKRTLPSLRWGVIAWTGAGRARLSPGDRNLLWWAMQVPVHEQMRGFQGEVLAEECEAKEGWHVCADRAIWEAPGLPGPARVTSLVDLRHPVLRLETGLHARLSKDTCACGRESARLLDIAASAR